MTKSSAEYWSNGESKACIEWKSTFYLVLFTCVALFKLLCWSVGQHLQNHLTNIKHITKRAIRIVNKVGYHEHTNLLYLKLHTLKFKDLVKLKTAQLIYKAINKQLPGNMQQLFTDRVGGYNLRGDLNLSQHRTRTKLKSMCISICGVLLWNGLSSSITQSVNMLQFKKRYKSIMLDKCRSG